MILGLCGRAGSGKTTIAEHLVDRMGFVKVSFKDALVAEMRERLPRTLDAIAQLYPNKLDEDTYSIDALFKNKPPIMRALMQEYGTEVRRGDDPQYWVDKWYKSLPEGDVVVDDVRFLNEADAVRLVGGAIVKIERDGLVTMNHVSELDVDKIEHDYVVNNSGRIIDALVEINKIVNNERPN